MTTKGICAAALLVLGTAGTVVAQTETGSNAAETSQTADTLQSAIESVLRKNPRIIAEISQRDIAEETLTQARSALRPQLNLSTSAGLARSGSNRGTFGNEVDYFDSHSQNATVGLEATQSLYSGGGLQAGVRQAKSGVRSADADLKGVVQTLILETATAYVDVRTAEAELDIRKQNVAALKTQLQAANDRFRVGEVTRTDVAQAEARLSGSQAAVASAQASLGAARANYYELVGRMPLQLVEPSEAKVEADEMEQAIENALNNNPNILSAQAVLDVARENVKIIKASRRPTVDLVGAAGFQQEWNNGNFNDDSVEIFARARMPIYQGGLLSSQVRQAKLEENRALMQLRATERALIATVSRAWYDVIAADQAITASERQVEAAQIAYDGSEQELAAGLRTTLDVLDQERELLSAKLNLVRSERDAYLARQQLAAAMGQLTPEKFGVNIPLSTPVDYSGTIDSEG